MRNCLIAALLILLVGAQTSRAETQSPSVTGNTIYETCKDSKSPIFAYCIGYIVGVNDGWNLGSAIAVTQLQLAKTAKDLNAVNKMLIGICSRGATNEQVVDIVIKYLKENPEQRHRGAHLLIYGALRKAFPCK